MPAPPEVADPDRSIRRVEVLGYSQSEHESQPHRHVRVTAEVVVDLEGVPQSAEPGPRGRERRVGPEHGIDPARDAVRDHRLLDEAHHEERDAPCHVVLAGGTVDPLQVLLDLAEPDDGPRHELREEAHVGQVLEHVVRGLHPPLGHVHDVRDGVERVEADADGQHDMQQRRSQTRRQLGEVAGREVVVLEEAEQGEVDGHGRDHPGPPLGLARRPVDHDAGREAHDAREQQQEAEAPVPPPVEDVAADGEDHVPLLLRPRQPEGREDDGQESEQEHVRVEHHQRSSCPRAATTRSALVSSM